MMAYFQSLYCDLKKAHKLIYGIEWYSGTYEITWNVTRIQQPKDIKINLSPPIAIFFILTVLNQSFRNYKTIDKSSNPKQIARPHILALQTNPMHKNIIPNRPESVISTSLQTFNTFGCLADVVSFCFVIRIVILTKQTRILLLNLLLPWTAMGEIPIPGCCWQQYMFDFEHENGKYVSKCVWRYTGSNPAKIWSNVLPPANEVFWKNWKVKLLNVNISFSTRKSLQPVSDSALFKIKCTTIIPAFSRPRTRRSTFKLSTSHLEYNSLLFYFAMFSRHVITYRLRFDLWEVIAVLYVTTWSHPISVNYFQGWLGEGNMMKNRSWNPLHYASALHSCIGEPGMGCWYAYVWSPSFNETNAEKMSLNPPHTSEERNRV